MRGLRPVGVTAAGWCGPTRGQACRPPAVAVVGLRRSGRTGNGESPRGRVVPACQPGPLSSHPMPTRDSAPGITHVARRTARSARP